MTLQGEQLVQQGAAFGFGKADDARGEVLADEQRLAAGFRMRAHDAVHHGLNLVDLLVRELGPPGVAGTQFLVLGQIGVFRVQRRNALLERFGQGFIRRVLVGKQGVAAFARQFLRVQQGTQAGRVLVGQVGMPEMPSVPQADGLAVFLDVGHDQYLRAARKLETLEHVDLQRPEAAAEIDLLLRRDVLVAEHQHMVLKMRAVNAGEILRIERPVQVQAQHLRAQRFAESTNLEILRRCIDCQIHCR